MNEEKNWRSLVGMSTDKELEKLTEAYQEPKVGDLYTDDELTEIIGIEREEARHRTVIERWKKYLFKMKNVVLKREKMIGYSVATPDERLDIGVNHKRRASRQVRKATKIIGSTNVAEISENLRSAYNHHLQWAQRTLQAELEEKRAMKMLPPREVSKRD